MKGTAAMAITEREIDQAFPTTEPRSVAYEKTTLIALLAERVRVDA